MRRNNKGKSSRGKPDQGDREGPSSSQSHGRGPQLSAEDCSTHQPSAGARPPFEEHQSVSSSQPQGRGRFTSRRRGQEQGRGFRRPDLGNDQSTRLTQGQSERTEFHGFEGKEQQWGGRSHEGADYFEGNAGAFERKQQREARGKRRGTHQKQQRGERRSEEEQREKKYYQESGDFHGKQSEHDRGDGFEQGRDNRSHYVDRRDQRGRGGFKGRGRGSDHSNQQGESRRYDDRAERHEQGRGHGQGDQRGQYEKRDFREQGREQKKRESIESVQSERVGKPEPSWSDIKETSPSVTAETTEQHTPSKQSSPEKLASDFEQLRTPSGLVIPHRKNLGSGVVGTRGKQILIEVNHLLLDLKKSDAVAIHYDVEFKPMLPKKLLRQVMAAFKEKHLKNKPCAFDGKKNIYSCGQLPFGNEFSDTVKIYDEERQRDRDCEVIIKFAAEVDLSSLKKYMNGTEAQRHPQEVIQALDIVLRNPSIISFIPVGRSFFSPPPRDRIIYLGDGLELWQGFYQSMILAWKPYLNVDVAHKGFPSDVSLIDFLIDMKRLQNPGLLQKEPLKRWDLENLEHFLKGLKIEYQIPGQLNTKRIFKVNRLKRPANEERFKLDDDRILTVSQYFEEEKKYRLKYPNMPCVHVGSETKSIFMPLELCKVVKGQAVNRKLNAKQTSAMVRSAAKPTDERKKKILEAIKKANFNNDPCVKDFGITVSQEFTKVKARILDPPTLQYADKTLQPKQGVWKAERLLNTEPLSSWVILNLDDRSVNFGNLSKLADMLVFVGNNLGIKISRPHDMKSERFGGSRMRDQLADSFKVFMKKFNDLQLVVVIIDDRHYGSVKQAAELSVGVLTQCITTRTMFKLNEMVCSNILLKINAKLNGINNSITYPKRPNIFQKPVMIIGADVTHPPPGEDGKPSIAAVTTSYDPTAFKCKMSWRIQPPRQELIVDLKNIMKEHLLYFYKKNNGLKPEKLIYYRDGVSEGQFSQVLHVEFRAIRDACSEFPDYKPAITVMVVQKRHHTRFFPTRPEDSQGKAKNVPPGTIVDTDITHPKEMDFYLVSHAGIQGTSRPTKYHKIWDDSDFDDDELEELTFYLCHLFARCTRSVSYPAHTYYAHLAAFRARAYMEGPHINIHNLEQEQKLRMIKTNIKDGSPMFFI